MTRCTLLAFVTGAALLLPRSATGQARHDPLESTEGLRLHNVVAQPATLQGKKGLRVTVAPGIVAGAPEPELLARIDGIELSNGVIEAEVAGAPAPGAFGGARGFVGIAFRLQEDVKTYDAFYLRPTNGRAEDQGATYRRPHGRPDGCGWCEC